MNSFISHSKLIKFTHIYWFVDKFITVFVITIISVTKGGAEVVFIKQPKYFQYLNISKVCTFCYLPNVVITFDPPWVTKIW